jgi:hypothetical protein
MTTSPLLRPLLKGRIISGSFCRSTSLKLEPRREDPLDPYGYWGCPHLWKSSLPQISTQNDVVQSLLIVKQRGVSGVTIGERSGKEGSCCGFLNAGLSLGCASLLGPLFESMLNRERDEFQGEKHVAVSRRINSDYLTCGD